MTFQPAMGVVDYSCGKSGFQLSPCLGRNFVSLTLRLLSGIINTIGQLQ